MRYFILLICILTLPAPPAPAQCAGGVCPAPSPFSTPVAQGLPAQCLAASTVRIINDEGGSQSMGSGAIVDKNGGAALVLTCGHLFREGVGRVIVVAADNRTYAARVLDIDSAWDMAVLMIGAPDAPAIPLAASPPAARESLAYAGYGPQGRFASGAGRLVGYVRMQATPTPDTLQLTGSARQGDSGGPIVNSRGQLVGLIVGTNGRIVIGPSCRPIRKFLKRFVGPAMPAGNDANVRPPMPAGNDAAQRRHAPPQQEDADVRSDAPQSAAPRPLRPHPQKPAADAPLVNPADDAPISSPAAGTRRPAMPGAGSAGPTDALALVLPLLLAALGISVPPTTVLLAIRVFRCIRRMHLRRARRKRRHTQSHPNQKGGENNPTRSAVDDPSCDRRRITLERHLNDDYAAQLASVFANSGRSPLQDATLGREFSREIDRAAASSDAKLAAWATDLRDRVMRRFHRIHGWTPSPAEPLE